MFKAQVFYKNMKQKHKQQHKKIAHRITSIPVLTVTAVFVMAMLIVPNVVHVRADQFDDQIKTLQSQNSQAQNSLTDLQSQATSYQDTINKLQAQISGLQDAINKNIAEQDRLSGEIQQGKDELARQKGLLAEDIKTMYVDGEPTTIEMLASSGSLSDFVDKEEYRTAVQNKIQDTLQTIQELQKKLELQKKEVDGLLRDQQKQQSELAGAKAQQDQLLSYNQGQQAEYNSQIKDNQSKIAGLRSQQAAENARLFAGANVILGGSCDVSHGDTYPTPWCNSGQDSMIDYWGMYNRECVSYTAWKVHESGRYMPYWGGIGNANQWDDNARNSGIPVDSTPRAGDVAIKNSMPYGHAMYVESVNGNGTINISQYNADYQGHFSRVYNMNPAGLVFVHF
jgi:surface antigen/peptidoglycan hydrolase CwlO-like protein